MMMAGRRRREPEYVNKRRENLFKRLYEFKERYGMRSWLILETKDGRYYTFNTEREPAPSEAVIVSAFLI